MHFSTLPLLACCAFLHRSYSLCVCVYASAHAWLSVSPHKAGLGAQQVVREDLLWMHRSEPDLTQCHPKEPPHCSPHPAHPSSQERILGGTEPLPSLPALTLGSPSAWVKTPECSISPWDWSLYGQKFGLSVFRYHRCPEWGEVCLLTVSC